MWGYAFKFGFRRVYGMFFFWVGTFRQRVKGLLKGSRDLVTTVVNRVAILIISSSPQLSLKELVA